MPTFGAERSGGYNKPFLKFGMSHDFDNSDLYEGGRYKRKRDFDDNSDDDSGMRSSSEKSEFSANVAEFKNLLVRNGIKKRNVDSNESSSKKNDISQEDRELARTTRLKDPFNKKIQNLTLKSRDNWFTKIVKALNENFDLFKNKAIDFDYDQTEMCVEFEHEIFQKAKNLVIYQSNSMKKINELKKYTKENRFYLEEYKKTKDKEDTDKEDSNNEESINLGKDKDDSIVEEIHNASSKFKKPSFTNKPSSASDSSFKMSGFASASTLLNLEDKAKTSASFKKEELNDSIKEYSFKEEPKLEKVEPKKIEEPKFDYKVPDKNKIISQIDAKPKEKKETKDKGNSLTLQAVSTIVVTELTVLYKAGKFADKVRYI
jgi:hypothetical protein